jgi:hypothetical protein
MMNKESVFRIRIRIRLGSCIRDRILNEDPDPGGVKSAEIEGKNEAKRQIIRISYSFYTVGFYTVTFYTITFYTVVFYTVIFHTVHFSYCSLFIRFIFYTLHFLYGHFLYGRFLYGSI